MRIGTRFKHADEAPADLPAEMAAAVASEQVDPGSVWTLTWLEGRPVLEHETGLRIWLDASGSISRGQVDGVAHPISDDDSTDDDSTDLGLGADLFPER